MKRLFILTFALFIVAAAIYGVSQINAQTNNPTPQTIIERIAQKFGLNQADVQTVFDDYRSERMKSMQAERRNRLEEKLTQSVSDGKITDAQKNSILKKFDELQSKHAAEQSDLESWAKANGLDNLGFGFKGFWGHKFGFGMRGMHWR